MELPNEVQRAYFIPKNCQMLKEKKELKPNENNAMPASKFVSFFLREKLVRFLLCFSDLFLTIPPFVSFTLFITINAFGSIFSISVFSLFSSKRVVTVKNNINILLARFAKTALAVVNSYPPLPITLIIICRISSLWVEIIVTPVYSSIPSTTKSSVLEAAR